MNINRKTSPKRSFLDSIYVESMRHGAAVTILVMAVISIGLGYLVYSLLLSGYIDSNREYKAEVARKELENKKTEAMLGSEPQFRAEFKKVADLFEEAKPLLPQETEISDVLAQVEASAKRNNVALTGLVAVSQSIKSPKAAKLYEREIPASVAGAFPNVVNFFADISRMPRILVISAYTVAAQKNSVRTDFTLVAFHAPPPAEIPPVPKDLAFLGGEQR